MKKRFTAAGLALRIWTLSSLLFSALIFALQMKPFAELPIFVLPLIFLVGSFPVFIVLLVFLALIKRYVRNSIKILALLFIELFCAVPYAALFILFDEASVSAFVSSLCLYASALIATYSFSPYMYGFFRRSNVSISPDFNQSSIKRNTMATVQDYPERSQSNKTLFKGLIAGGLVLIMLIPALLIQNLVAERDARHKDVVREVSAKWATSQTLAGPFLMVPYIERTVDKEGKGILIKKDVIILSQEMNVNGQITPVSRPRSIYKVLLYKSNLNVTGSFQPQWPTGIDTSQLDFANAKICMGLSDFKGIEEEIKINFGGRPLAFTPGLPENYISQTGLSVPIALTFESLQAGIKYDVNLRLKGSERLHFMPLSANSSFVLKSSWPNPSFDGNALPNERNVTSKGFDAKWNYNQANLPFGTVMKSEVDINQDISFGVSMVQPADQYNKTMRAIKYAVLIIGLTFALFFIIEIMQGRPFHPVQYVLVGLALVIFYTLLLAISEYILFDYAYLLAAGATILLVALYAKSHFQSWKTASIFASVLSMLYGFIFILLRLEDTALLVGSIGLFIVLAIVMYVSRKVNWYGNSGLEVGR